MDYDRRLQAILNLMGADLKLDGWIGPKSLGVLEKIVRNYAVRNNVVFAKDEYVLIGLRTDEVLSNTFDDYMVIWKNWDLVDVFPCSTTAGKYYVQNPLTVGGITGTAILQPGYYTKAYAFVTAANWKSLWLQAPYFQQVKPVYIWRDGDKDDRIDKGIRQWGYYGINIHHASWKTFIDRWSAGCQVVMMKFLNRLINPFKKGQLVDYWLVDFWPC